MLQETTKYSENDLWLHALFSHAYTLFINEYVDDISKAKCAISGDLFWIKS